MMFSSILMALPLVDFEHVILGNIKAPAHFLVVLTPSALERCDEPADWLRREIETALDIRAILCPSCWGRPNTRVTSRHLNLSNSTDRRCGVPTALMSRPLCPKTIHSEPKQS